MFKRERERETEKTNKAKVFFPDSSWLLRHLSDLVQSRVQIFSLCQNIFDSLLQYFFHPERKCNKLISISAVAKPCKHISR